jgi:hypothetical protein
MEHLSILTHAASDLLNLAAAVVALVTVSVQARNRNRTRDDERRDPQDPLRLEHE